MVVRSRPSTRWRFAISLADQPGDFSLCLGRRGFNAGNPVVGRITAGGENLYIWSVVPDRRIEVTGVYAQSKKVIPVMGQEPASADAAIALMAHENLRRLFPCFPVIGRKFLVFLARPDPGRSVYAVRARATWGLGRLHGVVIGDSAAPFPRSR